MAVALFTLFGHIQRAGRKGNAATAALLRLIAERIGIRPSEAALELGLHQSTVTRQAQALEAAGFVTSEVDENDRRASTLSITPAGRRELARLGEDGLATFVSFVDGWKRDDVRSLGQLLEQLTTTLAETKQRDA